MRLFGATLEAPKGAVVDNLGVVNATAKQLAKNNLPEHWQNQLAHRARRPRDRDARHQRGRVARRQGHGMTEHEQLFGELLAARSAAANPNASCLVISPLDQLDWRTEAMPPRDSIPAMVEAQRRAAKAKGCAFWDTYRGWAARARPSSGSRAAAS